MRGCWRLDLLQAQRAHVVDLLLQVGPGELVVEAEPVAPRAVRARGVPERGVEDEHGPGGALGRDRVGAQIAGVGGRHLLLGAGNHQGRSVRLGEGVDGEHDVHRCQVAVQHAREVLVEAELEQVGGRLARGKRGQDEAVLEVEHGGIRYGAVDDGEQLGDLEEGEEEGMEPEQEAKHPELAGPRKPRGTDLLEDALTGLVEGRSRALHQGRGRGRSPPWRSR